jgi:hypothetical protein
MCLPFQHMVELTTHLKRNWLRYAFDDNTSDDEFLKISAVIPKLIEAQNPISSFI